MRPFAVLTAIVLGSATAIAFGLSTSLIVFLVLSGKHPEFSYELPKLLRFSVAFVALAGIAGAAFYSLQKGLHWRWTAQGAMWGTVVLIAWYGWPKPL